VDEVAYAGRDTITDAAARLAARELFGAKKFAS